ncbi:TetR/AcrR family transcriptional regulator [Devosia sp. 63-57]|uniref:TetR/AcrR family transcriptional regulator n=1 Tax=Devosia sp. 63-57 TaxID=1895751 RepID=UPI00086CE3FC|nr:TetR/AcrR family transcriptional regulator [Devosia sp. 63-57]ODT49003.1 MAG: hypothetical protein ABS74_10975 [Pelagibacterium sp. SCN 63-126]ODU82990.1 MAG: hypothetical protein ABT14_16325 [Pelagibacterium sp. SCN 63-17]OJX44066.1 MAG: hypothetical protein BGO80_00235 [Devosia sp. 63-57]
MNKKYSRTQTAISNSVLKLASTLDFKDITVQMVIDDAGTTRPTFYNHFRDVEDAARFTAISMMSVTTEVPPQPAEWVPRDADFIANRIRVQVRPVLEIVASHRAFFRRVLEQAANLDYFNQTVAMFMSKADWEFRMATEKVRSSTDMDVLEIVANGAMWMVIKWTLGDNEASVDELTDRFALTLTALVSGQLLQTE